MQDLDVAKGGEPAASWEAGRTAFRMLKVEGGLVLKLYVV
jgi:hypothetical protein